MPFIYSVGIAFKPLKSFYLRCNGSKNYRVPTYNDLFWPNQGNVNLIPETANQVELGIGFEFTSLKLDLAMYSIDTKNKIVWTPSGDPERPGVWFPNNVSKTNNRGFEFNFKYKHKFNRVKMHTVVGYSHILAKDLKNNKFLVFVPKHMLNGNFTITNNKFLCSLQSLYNGEVYTTQDNESDFTVSSFFVTNALVEYKIHRSLNSELRLGMKINNLLGEKYEVMPRRPMPLRNLSININYKF